MESNESLGIAGKIMNSLEELLKSSKTKELDNLAIRISKDLTAEIILKASENSLTSEIEKLNVNSKRLEWGAVAESYTSFSKNMSDVIPECQTINKYLSKIEGPLNILSKKYGLCNKIIENNVKLKENIDECLAISEETVKEIYNNVISREWTPQMKYIKDHFELNIEGDYDISQDSLKANLRAESPGMILLKRIEAIKKKMNEDYQKKLNAKTKYSHVIQEIKKAGKIGEAVPYIAEIEAIFDSWYFNNKKEVKASGEKLSEDPEQRKEQAENIVKSRTGQLLDFIDGVESYNSATKWKDIQLQNIERIEELCFSRISNITEDYKEKLKDNEFFSNLASYTSQYNSNPSIKIIKNLKE